MATENKPVSQANHDAATDDVADGNRDQIVDDKMADGEIGVFGRICADSLPEFRASKSLNTDADRDHKHVCDAVLEAGGDEHGNR